MTGKDVNSNLSFQDLPPILNVSEVARLLGIGRNSAYGFLKSGAVHAVRVGRQIRVSKAEIERFMEGTRDKQNKFSS